MAGSIKVPLAAQRWISPCIILLLWELAFRAGLTGTNILAPPSMILAALWKMSLSGELPANLAISFARIAVGLAIGSLLGIVLAIATGLSRRTEVAIDPLVQIGRTIPTLALTPLVIIWLGVGEAPKIFLIALGTLFPIYINLFNGIRATDPRLLEAARVFGLSRRRIILDVILPGSMPALLVGLRFALAIAVLVLVIAEQINATSGLGALINNARDMMRTDIVVICIAVYAGFGLAADALVRWMERHLLAWRPSILSDQSEDR